MTDPVHAPVPSVGRAVHYVSHGSLDGQHPGGECRAAIITEVPPQTFDRWAGTEPQDLDAVIVDLFVMTPSGQFHNESRQDEDGHAAGTWHWPERVG